MGVAFRPNIYERWYRTPKGKFVDVLEKRTIRELCGVRRGNKILEIGCGTGHFSAYFEELGAEVVGLDTSPEMLKMAKDLRGDLRVDFSRGNAYHLPFDDNSFDLVAMITTLEFISSPGKALEEAFRVAAHDGDNERVRTLLQQGVNCDAEDQDGHTALMFAAFNGHSEIVLYLLDHGAEIDRTDYMGRTALIYASTGPFPETVRILLDRGADPNKVDSDEHFSPLMHAAAEGHLEVVKALVAHGADRSLKDVDGDNAASFALRSGHGHVVEYLNSVGD